MPTDVVGPWEWFQYAIATNQGINDVWRDQLNTHISILKALNRHICKYYITPGVFVGKCVYCCIELDEENYSYDHALPVSEGGDLTPHNFVPACKSCNTSRKTQDPIEYIRNSGRDEKQVEWYSRHRKKLLEQLEEVRREGYEKNALVARDAIASGSVDSVLAKFFVDRRMAQIIVTGITHEDY